MNPEAVLISYSITEDTGSSNSFGNSYVTTSGIKLDERWILAHGSLVSILKAATSILKSAKNNNNDISSKNYRHLPYVYVTYENTNPNYPSKDGAGMPNFLNNIVVANGKIKLIWRSDILSNIIYTIFPTWTIGNKPGSVESQNEWSKFFLPTFVLIDIGDPNHPCSPTEILEKLLQYLPQHIPRRSDEVYILGTPFGNEIFLNSMTKGAVSNVVGRTSNVLLCDAPTSFGYEGGPVFFKKSKRMMGMTISSLSWFRGEWVGITLVAFLTPVIHEFLYPLNPYQDKMLSSPKDLPFDFLLDSIDSSVALVRCGNSWGSGVVIKKSYILTCSHVVIMHKSQQLSIYLKGKCTKARVVFRSRDNIAYDLALLHYVDNSNCNDFIPFATSRPFKGENVVAVGYPFFNEKQITGIKPTITKGTINNVSPHMIQTSCCVQSGYSGGAILRVCNEKKAFKCYLLGIIVCNAKDENLTVFPYLNMSIPANAFSDLLVQFFNNPTALNILERFENPTQHAQSLWKLQFYNSKL